MHAHFKTIIKRASQTDSISGSDISRLMINVKWKLNY